MLLRYTLGADGYQVEEVYNFPSTDKWADKSSQHDIGKAFEGLKLEAYKELG
jgi:hypothetical protein